MQTLLKKLIVLMLVCLPGFLLAQQKPDPEVDSLVAKLANTTQDTAKVSLYCRLSYIYVGTDRDQTVGKAYAQKALSLSQTIKWDKGMALAYFELSLAP